VQTALPAEIEQPGALVTEPPVALTVIVEPAGWFSVPLLVMVAVALKAPPAEAGTATPALTSETNSTSALAGGAANVAPTIAAAAAKTPKTDLRRFNIANPSTNPPVDGHDRARSEDDCGRSNREKRRDTRHTPPGVLARYEDFLACLAARFSLRDLPTFLVFFGDGTFGMA
jgi:hypothetical protein